MIFEQLGFRKSPYFWEELGVSAEGFELFVGRQQESRRFIIDCAEPEGRLLVVAGNSGIGKTSFVNYNQYVLYQGIYDLHQDLTFRRPRVVPCLRKIQLREGEDIPSIYLKILSGLLFSVQEICRQEGIGFPHALTDIREFVTQVVSRSASGGFGLTIAGFGGNANFASGQQIVDTSEFRELTVIEFLKTIVEIARTELQFDGVMVPINNLDIVSLGYLAQTLAYMRDSILSLPGFWWILLGGRHLHRHISQLVPRIAGALSGDAIELGRLGKSDLEQLLAQRRKVLALYQPAPPLPISPRIIHYLYDKSDGDIRFAFHVANDVVRRIFYDFPSIGEIDEKLAAEQTARLTVDRLKAEKFTPTERRIILHFVRNPEATSVALADLEEEEDLLHALESLVERRFLSRDLIDSGDQIFSAKGFTALAQTFNLGGYPSLLRSLET